MRQQYDNKKMTRDGFVIVLAASVFVFASPQPSAAFSSVRFHSVGSVRPTGAPSIRRRGKMTNVYMGDEDAPAWNRREMLSIATYVALSQPWPESACAASQPPGDIVLLIGATSVLGQRACEQLLKRGYSVRGLTRRQADVKKAVAGTRLADVEWVEGNLNQISDFAPGIIKGVKKIIFAPILASRAGLDPNYAGGAAVYEDIAMNRRIFTDAVGELARLAAMEKVDKFVLLSSAGVLKLKAKPSDLDEFGRLNEQSLGLMQGRIETSLLNQDVIGWKKRGEEILKASGVPYTIVRAHSPPPRPWNEPNPKDYTIAIFQEKVDGVSGVSVITAQNLADVCVEAALRDNIQSTTFQAIDVRNPISANSLRAILKVNPRLPPDDWKGAMDTLAKDEPLTKTQLEALLQPPSPSPSEIEMKRKLDEFAESSGYASSFLKVLRDPARPTFLTYNLPSVLLQ